jgi:hypothetical protein
MKYYLTDTLTKINETKGTVYNDSTNPIELTSSSDTPIGSGIPLRPKEKITFEGTIYARAYVGLERKGTVIVESFVLGGDGDTADGMFALVDGQIEVQ